MLPLLLLFASTIPVQAEAVRAEAVQVEPVRLTAVARVRIVSAQPIDFARPPVACAAIQVEHGLVEFR